jgi:hypothetical protein
MRLRADDQQEVEVELRRNPRRTCARALAWQALFLVFGLEPRATVFFLNSDPPIGGPDSPLPASALRSARLPASRTPRQRTEHSSDLQTSLATPRAGQQTCACGEITKKRTADHDKGLAFASASTRPLAAPRPRGCTDTRQEDSAATLVGGLGYVARARTRDTGGQATRGVLARFPNLDWRTATSSAPALWTVDKQPVHALQERLCPLA